MKLHSPEFAADPHRAYEDMRRAHGPVVPVEIAAGVPATLVIGYREALHVLGDPARFPADPRTWQSALAAECPALPMQCQFDAWKAMGERQARCRDAYSAALGAVDQYALRIAVERAAVPLVNSFCETGSADLLAEYAIPLTVQVLNEMLGFTPEAGSQAYTAITTLSGATDTTSAELGTRMLSAAILETLWSKRAHPAADVMSRLLAHCPDLDDAEIAQQTAVLYATGTEPTWNLIANTLLVMVTDEDFGGGLIGGTLSVRDAIDEVLFTDPPLANFCFSYPRQPQIIGDVWLPEHQPVVVSLAACNNDPAAVSGDRTGNRAHLAWGAGAHSCPAQSIAMVIVQEALDQLLDALPEMQLAVPAGQLRWRPGGLHRALAALPATFPPSPPLPA